MPLSSVLASFFLLLQAAGAPAPSAPTGLEWMLIASVVVPAVLLVALVYLGSRRTVQRRG